MFVINHPAVFGLALLAWLAWAQQSCGGAKPAADAQNASRPANNQSTPPAGANTPAPTPTPDAVGQGRELRTLAEGAHGPVEEPFVAVVRDAETYAELRALVGELPELKEDFFASNAVLAVFLGTRPTGGYSVQITSTGGALRVAERRPEKGAMLTQALTQPFKVVSVGAGAENPLRLEVAGEWGAWRGYRVAQGSFEQSGGIAGRVEQFQLGGTLRTARLGKLVTVAFDLTAKGASKPRALPAFVTGLAADGGKLRLPRLDAGTLVEQPNGGLTATGQFSDGDKKLSVAFEPLPDNVADGFDGRGKLEAESDGATKTTPGGAKPS